MTSPLNYVLQVVWSAPSNYIDDDLSIHEVTGVFVFAQDSGFLVDEIFFFLYQNNTQPFKNTVEVGCVCYFGVRDGARAN